MILEVVREGKRAGVTATSHKVIRNLLDEVVKAAKDCGMKGLRCVQKLTDMPEEQPQGITLTTDGNEALAALSDGAHGVGGTAWLWASEKLSEAVDILFIDEAGQIALANVPAVSNAAKNKIQPVSLDDRFGLPARRSTLFLCSGNRDRRVLRIYPYPAFRSGRSVGGYRDTCDVTALWPE